ncbi:leucine-rich repeat-containing serine/threonine-protein kinase [Roseococcus sp. SDR]|uniref:leucine-rich repeat-containing protein kinase family protein n=1 Tax=Roseococcus sp. SDR TaxID=2835532 RepID=UPI001BCE8EA5|nr:leucine-rich repeat-containing protein kinase family protein [Roseococcus sp. SDR]MBS7792757.1 serine/threonine-protein kinase [Roseococcus sp. SDR]MBV1848071.1 leucine-rich repeat-containing serine/threonine-protein kinase [Roseococcus sp. SDR]
MSQATLDALRRGDLAGARELRLPHCGLTEFPREIFGLAETLEVLDLGGNALSHLPADFGNLRRLRVLFGSNNRFARLPPALGDCAELSQVGFRATRMREVPAEALPPKLRWLTLTDNHIASLPAALGGRPALQKLMLAGNELNALPESLAEAPALELLRIGANRFEALPGWLAEHPTLAWLGLAGNPALEGTAPAPRPVPWTSLTPGTLLGEGASGRVYHALWREDEVALKLFKGAMTSDGLPRHEMAASLAAGAHPNLMGALGEVRDHPEGLAALVMPLIPSHWRALAGPPSLESCTRDVYAPGLCLEAEAALTLARGLAAALAHLHGAGVLHGDFYAHNILWDGVTGAAVLGDFGAAALLRPGDAALTQIETRAFGILLAELLALAPAASSLRAIAQRCLAPRPADRPSLAEVAAALG